MAGRFAAMRALIPLLLALLFSAPALADDWGRYTNARFGFGIDVPPGFDWGRESENGDGRPFRDGARKLSVWGGNILEQSFESAALSAIGFSRDEGWMITYEAVTPGWVSFSGTQGPRVLYARMIPLCEGQYAAFRLEYSAPDIGPMSMVIERLVQTLEPAEGC